MCTPECQSRMEAHNRVVREYEEKYPGHCETCRGWGGRTYSYDPSPAGVGLSPGCMWDFDPCEDCTCQGKCPRCGEKVEGLGDENVPCPHCGWTEKDGGLPEAPECWCFYEEDANDPPW